MFVHQADFGAQTPHSQRQFEPAFEPFPKTTSERGFFCSEEKMWRCILPAGRKKKWGLEHDLSCNYTGRFFKSWFFSKCGSRIFFA
jgi:hypothetical protein